MLQNDRIKYSQSQWHPQSNRQWYPRHWQVPFPHLPLMEIGQGRKTCALHVWFM
jgi:hypothetical protein